MKKNIIAIVLLSALTVPAYAQEATAPAKLDLLTASDSAQIATPSAEATSSSQPEISVTQPPQESTTPFIDQETIKNSAIFVGIMVLILIAFIAGKKSSDFSQEKKS
jgi:hypothetical protein